MLTVNRQRLQQRIDELSRIGRHGTDGGIYRMAFSEGDLAGRAWFCRQIESIGLIPEIDGAANISACYGGEAGASRVVMGSHLDSVPGAGHLDGALGVLVALECVQCLKESEVALVHPVEAVSFTDEEGRFGGMLGSQALAGHLSPQRVRQAKDLEGVTLSRAMAEAGYNAEHMLRAERPAGSIRAYLELHIEQGPVLDRLQLPVGVVTGIAGLFKWQVTLRGESNHAGTTPMDMRRDAFQGLVEFAGQLQRLLDEFGAPNSRATIGRVELRPGAGNVIPGRAIFSLEVRDTDSAVLAELAQACRRSLSAIGRRRELMVDFEVMSELSPTRCDPLVVDVLRRQAKLLQIDAHEMPSGAAHDCQIMATVAPAAMIFVPSKDGRSHSPAEWTSMDDIETGANLALNTLYELAGHP